MIAVFFAMALGGLAAACAVARWLRERRTRDAADAKVAALEARLAEQLAGVERRAALLRTVVEATPVAMVLFADSGTITFTNQSARDLFFDGAAVEGQNFLSMIARAPAFLQRALLSKGDELFTVDTEGESETFHLLRRSLEGGQTLISVSSVTQEINRHEVGSLKKVIRIISHEINNSLGPISSLANSAKLILQRPEHLPRLLPIFDTIQERAVHLQGFLDGYARLAKIPQPQPVPVPWGPFLDSLRVFWPELAFEERSACPGYFDRAQIQQVLINLIKNAQEAGGPREEVRVIVESPPQGGCRVSVLDRGPGVSDEVVQNLFLPFFTTKPSGSGLGLALSREIVEFHDGRLSVVRREGGGLAVRVWLPDRERGSIGAQTAGRVRLSLTRT